MRLRGGDFLILAWHGLGGDDDAMELYRERWRIETLFQKLKGHGFNLEESRLRGGHKAETLLGVLALAAAWCYALGEWHSEEDRSDTAQKARAQGRGDVSSRAEHIAAGLRQVRGQTKPRRETGLFLINFKSRMANRLSLATITRCCNAYCGYETQDNECDRKGHNNLKRDVHMTLESFD